MEIIHQKYALLHEKQIKLRTVDFHDGRPQPVGRCAFAFDMFTWSPLWRLITEEDRPLNACTTHSGEHIRFEVVINAQTENSCRDQDETPERHRSAVPLHPRKLIFLPLQC